MNGRHQYFGKLCFGKPRGRKSTQQKESQRHEELVYRHLYSTYSRCGNNLGGGEGSSGTETSICPLTIEGLVQLQRWGLPSQTGSGSTVCPLERAALRFAFLLRAALGPTLDHWFLELGSSCPRGGDAVLLPCTMDLWQKLLCIRQAISKPGLFLHQDARGRGAPGSWRTR